MKHGGALQFSLGEQERSYRVMEMLRVTPLLDLLKVVKD